MVLLGHFLRQQDGVITYAQAREAGLTPTQIKHRKATGRWARVGPQVYFVADRPFSASARLRTAVYSAGRGAAADGLSAAWWHGLTEQLPALCTVTVPRTRSPRIADCRVRRRDLHHRDLVGFRDLWVTDLALTVLECAVLPGGPALLDRALQRRVRLPQLHAAHERNAGRYGAQRAARLLTVAADRAGSHAERVLLRLLREAGITGWRPNHPVLRYRVDVAFPAERLAVEVDGWAWHQDIKKFGSDRNRQNELTNAGWRVLRFTWVHLTENPATVIRQIRHELARTSAR